MSINRTISLRPKALTDLEDIFVYSVSKFGLVRAEQYILDLNEAFIKLAEEPHIGKDYSHVKQGLMGYSVVSHIVFFNYTRSLSDLG